MKTKILDYEKTNGQQLNGFTVEDIGDDHLFTGLETPMKANAFSITDEEKKKKDSFSF